MKLPDNLFEEEDIKALEARTKSKIRRDAGWVYLTNQEWACLEKMMEDQVLVGKPSQDKSALLRATATILALERAAKTVADRAALLAAALAVYSIDPGLGRRLINSIRVGPVRS